MFGLAVDVFMEGSYAGSAGGPFAPAQGQPQPHNAALWGTDQLYWASLPITIHAPPTGTLHFDGKALHWGTDTLRLNFGPPRELTLVDMRWGDQPMQYGAGDMQWGLLT